MRATLRGLLVADVGLTALIPPERWFQQGAVVDVPPMPFAIIRWISPVRGDARGTFAHQLQIEVHDDRGNYARIDRILGGPYKTGGVYPILAGIADVSGVDGRIIQADYLGDSGDDQDGDYRSNMKQSRWQVIGRSL